MAQITFNYEGKDYTLEFTLKTVKQMERSGFIAEDFLQKPATYLPELFAGAFLAHHSNVKRSLIDEIYSKLTDKQGLITALTEMYNEPIQALMDDPDDGNKGNVTWTAVR